MPGGVGLPPVNEMRMNQQQPLMNPVAPSPAAPMNMAPSELIRASVYARGIGMNPVGPVPLEQDILTRNGSASAGGHQQQAPSSSGGLPKSTSSLPEEVAYVLRTTLSEGGVQFLSPQQIDSVIEYFTRERNKMTLGSGGLGSGLSASGLQNQVAAGQQQNHSSSAFNNSLKSDNYGSGGGGYGLGPSASTSGLGHPNHNNQQMQHPNQQQMQHQQNQQQQQPQQLTSPQKLLPSVDLLGDPNVLSAIDSLMKSGVFNANNSSNNNSSSGQIQLNSNLYGQGVGSNDPYGQQQRNQQQYQGPSGAPHQQMQQQQQNRGYGNRY